MQQSGRTRHFFGGGSECFSSISKQKSHTNEHRKKSRVGYCQLIGRFSAPMREDHLGALPQYFSERRKVSTVSPDGHGQTEALEGRNRSSSLPRRFSCWVLLGRHRGRSFGNSKMAVAATFCRSRGGEEREVFLLVTDPTSCYFLVSALLEGVE